MSKCRPARLLISLALAALLSLAAIGGLALADGPLVGEIKIYAGSTLPNGWLWADGSELTRTSYPALFDVLSTTYGSATTETFTLPDLSARVPIGTGVLSSTNFYLGNIGGEISHTLTITEIPQHTHIQVVANYTSTGPAGPHTDIYTGNAKSMVSWYLTGSTGGGKSHNNLAPYLAVNYIIYTGIETGTYNYMLNSGTVFEVTPTMDFGQAMLIGILLVWFMCKIYSFVFRLVYRR